MKYLQKLVVIYLEEVKSFIKLILYSYYKKIYLFILLGNNSSDHIREFFKIDKSTFIHIYLLKHFL